MSAYPVLVRFARLLFGAALAAVGMLGAGETGGWEFRGAVKEGDVWLVNLLEIPGNVSRWIPVGGEAAGVLVRGYDEDAAQITIVQQGRARVLPLKQYRISVSGPIAPLKLLGPGERVSAAQAPDMPDYLRDLPPDARKLLEGARRRRAIRWPAMTGTIAPIPQ